MVVWAFAVTVWGLACSTHAVATTKMTMKPNTRRNQVVTNSSSTTNTITFVHINDHHSHFEEVPFELVGEMIPSGLSVETSRLRAQYGGVSRTLALAQSLTEAAREAGKEAFLIHGGDAITGTLFYTFYGPTVDAAVMNTAGFDAFVIGNHEFDQGDSNLADLIRLLNSPVLSYNVQPGPNSTLNDLKGDNIIRPYLIREVQNGNRIGFCGITTKVITEQSSRPDPGTTIGEEEPAARACVAELQSQGVNKIVILSHVGLNSDRESIAQIDGVDLIIGSHSHSLLGGDDFVKYGFEVRGEYAAMVNGTCLVQAWEYSKALGYVDVTFDENGDVVSCSGSTLLALNPTKFTVQDREIEDRFDLNDRDAAIVAESLLNTTIFRNAGESEAILAALKPFQDQLEMTKSRQIATVAENLCRSQIGEADPFCPDKDKQNRVGGSVCYIVAKGFLYNVKEADIAITNHGGCRSDILEGSFTYGTAFEVLPFANVIVSFTMTGDQVRRLLEDAFNYFLDPGLGGEGGIGAFPTGAGVRWHVDYTKPYLERISNLEVNVGLLGDWVPIDMEAQYIVVTNNFLSESRDGYFVFGEIDKESDDFVNYYIEYAQSLINYAFELGSIEDIPISEFSTQYIVFEDGSVVDLQQGQSQSQPTAAPTTPTETSEVWSPSFRLLSVVLMLLSYFGAV